MVRAVVIWRTGGRVGSVRLTVAWVKYLYYYYTHGHQHDIITSAAAQVLAYHVPGIRMDRFPVYTCCIRPNEREQIMCKREKSAARAIYTYKTLVSQSPHNILLKAGVHYNKIRR